MRAGCSDSPAGAQGNGGMEEWPQGNTARVCSKSAAT